VIELFAYDRDEDRLKDIPIQSSCKIVRLWDWKPDAVIICVPPDQHDLIAMQALTRGEHVLCEKPLTTDYTEAKQLCDEAHAQKKILAVGYQLRFCLSEFRARTEHADSIYFVCAQDMSTWPSQYKKDTLEEFSHEIASAVFCKGPVEALTAQEYAGRWDIRLRHLQGYSNVTLDSTSKSPCRLARASNGMLWSFDSLLNDQVYRDQLGAFLAACTGGPWDERLCSGAEAAHVVRIIECCRESSKRHSVVLP
jgi:predicted dehydrogenase